MTPPPGHRHYAGLSHEERRAERRRRLLDAALDLFATRGYASTSIESVCRRARVTARNFYDEFPGREALLTTLYDEMAADTLDALEAALADAPDDVIARATAGVSALVHAMLDDPRRARVSCVEAVGVSPALEHHRREWLHRFARVVEVEARRLAGKGLIGDRDPGLASVGLVGGTYEIFVEVLTARRVPAEDLIEELTRFFIAVASSA